MTIESSLAPPAGIERPVGPGRRRSALRRAFRSRTLIAGCIGLGFWIAVAILWPLLVPHDPQESAAPVLAGPSADHWFGTDHLGRDVFSRVLAGASPVLRIAPASAALSIVFGTLLGLTAGYHRGLIDEIAMRVVDALLSFPVIVTGMVVVALVGPSELTVVIAITVIFTPIVARTVRGVTLSERGKPYVASALLRGDSSTRVMFTEILPNIVGAIVVEATVRLGFAIFVASSLSFLDVGVPQPSPDWGLSVALARPTIQVSPWPALFPSLAIASLMISVFLVIDGLQRLAED